MQNMLDRIDWKKSDLVPVIAQDAETNEVLMLAYMNKEALSLSLQTRQAHYFSRSKQRIWKKGESSGHIKTIRSFMVDCDNDTLLLKVEQEGVACHTGHRSCFFTELETEDTTDEKVVDTSAIYGVIDTLYHTIQERKNADPATSWTAKLFSKGENTILKKVVEEAGEFSFAVKDDDAEEIVYEAVDFT